jgi:hypothetical protein
VANAKVGKSDYERTSAGTRGNAEHAPTAAVLDSAPALAGRWRY